MDIMLTTQLGTTWEPLAKPMEASALDRYLLCSVTYRTVPAHLGMSGDHHETLTFHLINTQHFLLIYLAIELLQEATVFF